MTPVTSRWRNGFIDGPRALLPNGWSRRSRFPSVEDIARRSIFQVDGLVGVDPTNAGFGKQLTIEAAGRPPFRQGVKALVGLYRLADFYPPGTDDGKILHRAAHELLPEFVTMINDDTYSEGTKRALPAL